VVVNNPALYSFLLLILISCMWSPVPLFTLRRAIVFMATTGFGLYLATRFEIKEQIRLVGYALTICVILSVVFVTVFPSYGEDPKYYGAWRGVFIHKNGLGTSMVISAITFLCFRAKSVPGLLGKYLGLAVSVCLLIGSESKGSYVVMLVALLLMLLYRLLHLYWKRLIPAATAAFVALAFTAAYVASNADAFFRALGKNASLTGRIPLWTIVLNMSSNHRLLGYGFAGFWAANSHAVWSRVGWTPSKAHNGFIDMLLDLGLLGLVIFALNSAIAMWRSMKLVAREKTLESQWPLMMLSVIFLYSVFEINVLLPNNFLWVAYVAITVSTQRGWSVSRASVRTAAPAANQFPALRYEPCRR